MTAAHDRKFFDTFMLVLGVLVAISVLIYVFARIVASGTQELNVQNDPAMKAAVAERIEPVAKVAVAGQDNSALAPARQAGAAAQEDLGGQAVYEMACIACHGAGIAGAPKLGDAAAWKSRLAKGMETLHKNALQGFQGDAGFMPPKGGRVDLSDQSIVNAVEYMVEATN